LLQPNTFTSEFKWLVFSLSQFCWCSHTIFVYMFYYRSAVAFNRAFVIIGKVHCSICLICQIRFYRAAWNADAA